MQQWMQIHLSKLPFRSRKSAIAPIASSTIAEIGSIVRSRLRRKWQNAMAPLPFPPPKDFDTGQMAAASDARFWVSCWPAAARSHRIPTRFVHIECNLLEPNWASCFQIPLTRSAQSGRIISGGSPYSPRKTIAVMEQPTAQRHHHRNGSQSLSWPGLLLRFVFYSCIATTATLPIFNVQCRCWGCTCKRRQLEGAIYVGSINKGQQAYYTETSRFSTEIEALEIGIKPETNHYRYQIVIPMMPAHSLNELRKNVPLPQIAIAMGYPKRDNFHFYLGIVTLAQQKGDDVFVSNNIVCKTKNSKALSFEMPNLTENWPKCPKGWKKI